MGEVPEFMLMDPGDMYVGISFEEPCTHRAPEEPGTTRYDDGTTTQ